MASQTSLPTAAVESRDSTRPSSAATLAPSSHNELDSRVKSIVASSSSSFSETEKAKAEAESSPSGRLAVLLARIKRRPIVLIVSVLSVALVVLTIVLAVILTRGRGQSTSTSPSTQPLSVTIGNNVKTLDTAPIAEAFVSFAIEFYFFPDFAGNISSPNTFSQNLLNNIGNISGQNPFVRVGGNTQDYALYNASLEVPAVGHFDYNKSDNYPVEVQIGPSFFDSYQAWSGIKFSHGFNMGLANTPEGWESLIATIPLACKALSHGNLQWWEYGNEPDLYAISPPRRLRSAPWNDTIYLDQWRNGTNAILAGLQEACPDLANDSSYGYVGPSLSFDGRLNPVKLFSGVDGQEGMNADGIIKEITLHNYMGTTTQPHVSLQKTLMNHEHIESALGKPISREIGELDNSTLTNPQDPTVKLPIVLNEANSLMLNDLGPKNLLNVFGDALWTVDYMLYAASIGVSRMQMQLGTNFRYSSWQPVTTTNMTTATLPPYYGNVAVAAMIGNVSEGAPTIVNEQLGTPYESAYSAYVNGSLKRVALINMYEYNTTLWADGVNTNIANNATRPSRTYNIAFADTLEVKDNVKLSIQRLEAAGSDVQSGITWDGWSYNYELDDGKPVRLNNVTVGETVKVKDGIISVTVPDSSAAILSFVS